MSATRLKTSLRFKANCGALCFILLPFLLACGSTIAPTATGPLSYAMLQQELLSTYALTGDTQPVHDPSMIRQSGTYYAFTTDVLGLPAKDYLPIRCSPDQVAWKSCGHIFDAIPAWVKAKVPQIVGLWAPDVSFFHGLYHVYYSGSTLGSQRSVIGFATNTTLDPTDPAYLWVDHGEVLETLPGADSNAIDPNILVDTGGSVWMQYGSYWTGIKQVQIDPGTGKQLGTARYDLADRPDVPNHPLEGASLVHQGGFYYLFVSIDYCCNADITTDNYKQAVGRSTGPNGPFVDMQGTPMLSGGMTVLLSETGPWRGAGGGSVYIDPDSGNGTLIFHALHTTENGAMYLWLKTIDWNSGWPVLG